MTYYYIKIPEKMPVYHRVKFMPIEDLVSDSAKNNRRCQEIFDMLTDCFKTRRKFLELWPHVRYVALIEEKDSVVSFAFASTPLNWQVDYVTTRVDKRGQNMAASVVNEITNQALKRKVPYLMLTSIPELKALYCHDCRYTIIGNEEEVAMMEVNWRTR